MIFDDALKVILGSEGGYANNPDDHGGATNFGITQENFNIYRRKILKLEEKPVRYIKFSEVQDIYKRFYWHDGKCDLLPTGLDLFHFDHCVNAGVDQAAKHLQRAVKVVEDGVIGSKTLVAIHSSDIKKVLEDYAEIRREFYKQLSRHPGQLQFLDGWLKRVDRTLVKSLKEYGTGEKNLGSSSLSEPS